MMTLQEAVLFRHLKKLGQKNPHASIFTGKLLELDEVVTEVLTLIPRTFPHYTEHGRRHYLTLIQRMGQFLSARLVKNLSAVECFLLMASAMLHDIGMVVAEEEIRALDKRKDFIEFCSRFPNQLPESSGGLDPQLKAVLDRQVVAEYFRASHHKRSAKFVFSHFGKFLAPFGPPNARVVKVLANVCEGHGLAREELENEDKFPLNVDVDGESANVRFLAATIRVADLLDMDSSRACPLILQLASPLPPGSIEHWTRHDLDDFSVSNKEIRIGRTCTNPNEQWALYQWVYWLDTEIRNTIAILARDPRTALVLPIPIVHISSDGSYEFPEFNLPLPKRPRIRRIQQVKKECPCCRTLLSYYQKVTERSIKALECAQCGARLCSVEAAGELHLRKRDAVHEQIVCPGCKKPVAIDVDPVPGTSHLLSCPSCNKHLRVIRGRDTLRVRLVRPVSPPVDEKFLNSVAEAMGPQRWPKGQQRKAAERLGVSQRSVSRAVQHLIRAGKFKFQVHGKLYAPEPDKK
jgi:DNA-binding MarR family transcriptional regulator